MYILYKTLFVLLLCIHVSLFSMSFERFFSKLSRSPVVEYIKSTRLDYDMPIINKNNESFFENFSVTYLQNIINKEAEREKRLGKKFVPIMPIAVLKKISFPENVTQIIDEFGQQFSAEFYAYYRKYKSIRGAWDLFIANIVAMEDRYGK